MNFIKIYLHGLLLIVTFFTLIWFLSIRLKNVSIVDIFWGLGFVLISTFFFLKTSTYSPLKILHIVLVYLWGIRLSIYILIRNHGKGEDYRYQDFRQRYGPERYWWFSYFQVFLLQGTLLWLISAPLLAVQYYADRLNVNVLTIFGVLIWLIGFTFEAGGDWQLFRFKRNAQNKGKVLQRGFWKYTRHPNYFGDAAVWWGFTILSLSVQCYLTVLSAVLMTWLLLKVSGVSLLEKTLKNDKQDYLKYVKNTSAFIPWFPKK